MVNINKLLEPVSSELPCGEDLEYDPAFLDLVNSATYVPARRMGNDEIPAVEPAWPEVYEKAETLLQKSKDLRIVVLLSKALLYKTGFEGFAAGLEILKSLVEKYWDSIHPLPDPDDNDMGMRINALSELGEYDFGIRKIAELPLISVRGLGDFGLKSLEEAKTTPQLQTEIDAAVLKTATEDLSTKEGHIAACIDHIKATQKLLSEKTESISGLDTLADNLAKARSFLAVQLKKRGANPSTSNDQGSDNQKSTLPDGASTETAPGVPSIISSPEDVKRTIDLICDYYEKNEPSSPLPILLARAKGLVSKNFMEIIEDISPDGLKQLKALKGPDKKG